MATPPGANYMPDGTSFGPLPADAKYADVVRKLELIEKVGAPAMRVLSSKALASYGAIPPFSANLTVDAKEALQDRGVVMFVSHRWLRSASGEPDDDARTKFKALVAFAHYYEHFYCRQAGARNIYFWIDYACIDQDNMLPGVQSLPLYVAASNDLLVYETKDYADRAWCCAEMVLAYCFNDSWFSRILCCLDAACICC